MKIKIPKPYWIVGTLVTAGIVTVGTYNFIAANTQEKIQLKHQTYKRLKISQKKLINNK